MKKIILLNKANNKKNNLFLTILNENFMFRIYKIQIKAAEYFNLAVNGYTVHNFIFVKKLQICCNNPKQFTEFITVVEIKFNAIKF